MPFTKHCECEAERLWIFPFAWKPTSTQNSTETAKSNFPPTPSTVLKQLGPRVPLSFNQYGQIVQRQPEQTKATPNETQDGRQYSPAPLTIAPEQTQSTFSRRKVCTIPDLLYHYESIHRQKAQTECGASWLTQKAYNKASQSVVRVKQVQNKHYNPCEV